MIPAMKTIRTIQVGSTIVTIEEGPRRYTYRVMAQDHRTNFRPGKVVCSWPEAIHAVDEVARYCQVTAERNEREGT